MPVNDLPKAYEPEAIEKKWYSIWVEAGDFKADSGSEKPPFVMVIPPPNVTGSLHMGHALNNTVQDILARFHRKRGFETLWLPGTDHAGIATQNVVERQLAAEGLTRHDLGRDKFVTRVWEWKERYGGIIISQLQRLGASCDWSRERFTLDQGCSRAVRKVFVSLYEKGLIYKGKYIINWCPRCHTALSDIEVEHEEKDSHLYYIRYPELDGGPGVVVATTRPETMFGDVAVAVNPEDERYADLIGKSVILPLIDWQIPVIGDEYVDKEFGTGALKITPAHDPHDFEIGLRHGLKPVSIMDAAGHLKGRVGAYEGLERYEARKRVLEDLSRSRLLVKVEDYKHSVGECYRCRTTVEPYLSEQWFVRMEGLARAAITPVRKGDTRFIPDKWAKVYTDWLDNIKDWCVSRQLWWGHRIPAWTCGKCRELIVAMEDPTKCARCGSGELEQDPDVLDTWFSSGLWPFSTLGWPDPNADLEKFYPTTALVTGHDIIFFWVARMMMSGVEFMNQVPFDTVYIHGIVRDEKGKKMSKSSGNVIDPVEVIDRIGADALRFTLIISAVGQDVNLSAERLEFGRNFCNKLWNAARFTLMNLPENIADVKIDLEAADLAGRWLMHRYSEVLEAVTANLEKYEFNEALQMLNGFVWHEFCDWALEASKQAFNSGDAGRSEQQAAILLAVFEGALGMLHPFMPFITEELWSHLPGDRRRLSVADWPEPEPDWRFPAEKQTMELLMALIRGVRNLRAEVNVPPGAWVEVLLHADEPAMLEPVLAAADYFKQLARVETVAPLEGERPKTKAVGSVIEGIELFLPIEGVIDIDRELARLEKEREKLIDESGRISKKLANKSFLEKAPEHVVAETSDRGRKADDALAKLEARINMLKNA